MPLGLSMIWGCYGNKGAVLTSSGTPVKNGRQVNDLLTAILLLTQTAVTKIKAHTKKTEPEYQENALADLYAKAAATESGKIVAHAGEVSAAAKNDPLLPDSCHPDVLATWQVCS